MTIEAGPPFSDSEVNLSGAVGPLAPDMKIDPGGQIDSDGNLIGNVDGRHPRHTLDD